MKKFSQDTKRPQNYDNVVQWLGGVVEKEGLWYWEDLSAETEIKPISYGQFNGIDNYSSHPSIDFSSNEVTVCAWIKTTTRISRSHIIAAKSDNNHGRVFLLFVTYTGTIRMATSDDGDYAAANNIETSGVDYRNGEWIFIIGIHSSTGNAIYINGEKVSETLNISNLLQTDLPLMIGANDPIAINFFDGDIREPQVFNRAITQEEVTKIYNGGRVTENCQLYINYDNIDGTTLYDSSGNGNDGTLYGVLTDFEQREEITTIIKEGYDLQIKGSNTLTTDGITNVVDTGYQLNHLTSVLIVKGKFLSTTGYGGIGFFNSGTNNRYYFGITTNGLYWRSGYGSESNSKTIGIPIDFDSHTFIKFKGGLWLAPIDLELNSANIYDVITNTTPVSTTTAGFVGEAGNSFIGSLNNLLNYNAHFEHHSYSIWEQIDTTSFSEGYRATFGEGQAPQIYDKISGEGATLLGVQTTSRTQSDGQTPHNIIGGFDLWQNDVDGTYLRVPLKIDGTSIKTDGDVITGYAWIERNESSPNGINNSENTYLQSDVLALKVVESNFIGDYWYTDGVPKELNYEDIKSNKNGANFNFTNQRHLPYISDWVTYGSEQVDTNLISSNNESGALYSVKFNIDDGVNPISDEPIGLFDLIPKGTIAQDGDNYYIGDETDIITNGALIENTNIGQPDGVSTYGYATMPSRSDYMGWTAEVIFDYKTPTQITDSLFDYSDIAGRRYCIYASGTNIRVFHPKSTTISYYSTFTSHLVVGNIYNIKVIYGSIIGESPLVYLNGVELLTSIRSTGGNYTINKICFHNILYNIGSPNYAGSSPLHSIKLWNTLNELQHFWSFAEGNSDIIYDKVGGIDVPLYGTLTNYWQTSDKAIPYNLMYGCDLWKNDVDDEFLHVPLKLDGTSIKTKGGTITNCTWIKKDDGMINGVNDSENTYTINNYNKILTTNSDGLAIIPLPNGYYGYTINGVQETFTIDGANLIINKTI